MEWSSSGVDCRRLVLSCKEKGWFFNTFSQRKEKKSAHCTFLHIKKHVKFQVHFLRMRKRNGLFLLFSIAGLISICITSLGWDRMKLLVDLTKFNFFVEKGHQNSKVKGKKSND
jgi:hypothetical protein